MSLNLRTRGGSSFSILALKVCDQFLTYVYLPRAYSENFSKAQVKARALFSIWTLHISLSVRALKANATGCQGSQGI